MESKCLRCVLFIAQYALNCVIATTEHSVSNATIDSVLTITTTTPTPNSTNKLEYRLFLAKDSEDSVLSDESVQQNVNHVVLNSKTFTNNDVKQQSADKKQQRESVSSSTTTQIYIFVVIGVAPAALAGLMWWFKSVRRKCIREKAAQKRSKRTQYTDNTPNPFLINDASIDQITYKIVQRAEKLNDSSAMWYNNYRPSSFVKSRRVYSLEVPRKYLDMIEVLGEGNFGQVWKAKAHQICDNYRNIIVAVKTNKINTSEKDADDLLKELDIMLQLGTHPNVVKLLGCCTENEPYFLIMEYVSNGKLLSYLRSHRTDRTYYNNGTTTASCNNNNNNTTGNTNTNNDNNCKTDALKKSLSSADLVLFSYQIAKGMEFISSHGIIHRDLAARNVLIDENKTCKVADFGLSRSIRDKDCDTYEQKTGGEMPIRWMSPESLSMGVFSAKSDVWAFGILLWEIVTLGSTPYIGMSAQQVIKSVRDGCVPERPDHCNDEFYALMKCCWAFNYDERLSFTELRIRLSKMIEFQNGYVDLDHFPENVYYNLYSSPGEKV